MNSAVACATSRTLRTLKRPVTPEVAGSSPVAPVKVLQITICIWHYDRRLLCIPRRSVGRPPAHANTDTARRQGVLWSLRADGPRAATLASPPLLLDRAVGAAGEVELVELRQVLVREREVEDLAVLGDPLAVGRLRDDRDLALEAPAEQDLRRRAPETLQ
jgi:hypothetical protein